ncbi:MAG: methionyl-tRNA formyltransferase [Ruminiclostridium sp.]|nr:methionyl-tRNA formyltransferase [Ruminiclostridium sp.]
MNIVFMGTPDFAVSALCALAEEHNVLAVFTQPDKPKNRGKKMQFPPVKEKAVELDIPVYQPLSLRRGDDAVQSLETLKSLNPDCIVVAAYGQILPKEILDLPKYGCINIHASLLPKYRGAAPIQWCIIDGEKQTGVTTMMMAEGLDTGDMLQTAVVDITDTMTAGELHDILAQKGAELILSTLSAAENGTLTPIKQDDSLSCYASMISKDMCRIDFSKPAGEVYNFIRGMSPSPCAYTFISDKRLKVYMAELCDLKSDKACGMVIDTNEFIVACGDNNCIRLTQVQGEGGKRMNAVDFLRGNKLAEDTMLG